MPGGLCQGACRGPQCRSPEVEWQFALAVLKGNPECISHYVRSSWEFSGSRCSFDDRGRAVWCVVTELRFGASSGGG